MNLSDLLTPGAIAPRVSADTKRRTLTVVSEIAARGFALSVDAVLEGLLAREAEGSTGVGHGVALPHARVPGLAAMRGVFVRLEQPVAFDAVDDQPVDLVFALLAPENAGSDHLRMLARVSRVLRRPKLREQLRQARSGDAIHALLVQEASASAA